MTDKANNEPFKETEKNLIKCFFKEYLNPKKDNILRIKEINFINMHEKYQVKIDFEKKRKY